MSQVSAAWKETDKLGSSVNYDAESIASTGTQLQGSKGIRQTADKSMYIPNDDTKKYPFCRFQLVWTLYLMNQPIIIH